MIFSTTLAYYYPLIITTAGCALIGLIAGCLGTFALLKKQSLLGDTISHAALPGIVLALIIGQQKDPAILLLGGAVAGTLGTLCTMIIAKTTTLARDTGLGVILSTFFGFGLLLISYLQKHEYADQAIINKFLFGNAALILPHEITTLSVVALCVLVLIGIFWKEYTLHIFDPQLCFALGFNSWLIDCLTTSLLIITIVVGIQTVGVILMSSLIIAPAAAARQWTGRMSSMMILSGCIGAGAATLGGIASMFLRVASGPMMVIILSCIVAFSLIGAPERGLLGRMRGKNL